MRHNSNCLNVLLQIMMSDSIANLLIPVPVAGVAGMQ